MVDERGISVIAVDYHAGEYILDGELEKAIYEYLKNKYGGDNKGDH